MENNEQKLFFGQTEKEYEEKHKDARKAINKYERGELLRAGKSVLAAPLSMIGVKGYWDVPMYLKQKLGLKGTKKRLKKDLGNLEQENITESDIEALEEREYGTRVAEVLDTAKIGELQDDIENDKNLSEESKNNLLEELNGLIENYSEERDGLRGEQKEKATNLLNEYAETKISGIQAAREGLRSFLIASGGFTAALGGYAITDGVGRYLNLEKKERRKAEKQETEKKKTKILKDVIVDGITKTFKNLTFTGEKKGVGRKSFDSVIAFANIFKYSGMAVASRESGGFGEMFKKVSEAGEGGLTVEKVGELLKSYGGDIKSGMKKGLDNILSTLKFEKSLGEMGENHKEAFKRVFSLPFGKERTDKILKIVGEYPGKIGDFMVGSASAAEGAPFALENIDSNDGNATIVSKDDGLNAIKLGVTSEKETNIGTEELPKNVAGDLGNNNDAETQQPITASVVNQQTGEDGNATTKVSSMENPIVPEPKLTKTEEMQKVYDEFVKNLEVKKEQTLDREKFQMLFLQRAINNGFDKNDIEGFLNKMSIDSPDMKLGEATEVDLTELRGEFKRGDSLWSTSRKFLEAKYDKDFGLVDKSTDEINALKTYNIDRMKDKIIEIISGRDDDL
ncbi:hypothetical protein HOC90_02575, partial [Candidatus Falkowbacteria bacterium]|nr:hypothetical protein [Candidatus Falkowbacteria bacterium]